MLQRASFPVTLSDPPGFQGHSTFQRRISQKMVHFRDKVTILRTKNERQ